MTKQKSKRALIVLSLRTLACLCIFISTIALLPPPCTAKERVRKPAVAGYFYPRNQEALKKTVDTLLSNVKQEQIPGKIFALMSPHAGYVYSGQVAAYAYQQIKEKKYETVIILGPSHRVYLKGASAGNWDAYATPLGEVPVNKEIVHALLEQRDLFQFVEKAHAREHSVETQIPFLQRALKNFDIVPIVMGTLSLEYCKKISSALTEVIQNRNVLMVASSDMSHFPNYTHANEIDRKTLSAIEKFVPEIVFNAEAECLKAGVPNLSTALCGLSSVVTVMMTAKQLGADKVKILHYANSGDVSIDGHRERRRVVGYGAAAFYKR